MDIFEQIQKAQLEDILHKASVIGDDELIQKAFSAVIEKGAIAQIGEIREWKGGKYKKTPQGWMPVTEDSIKSKSEQIIPGDNLIDHNNEKFRVSSTKKDGAYIDNSKEETKFYTWGQIKDKFEKVSEKKEEPKKSDEFLSKEEFLNKIGKVLGYSNIQESQILSWRGNNPKAEKLIDEYKKRFVQ